MAAIDLTDDELTILKDLLEETLKPPIRDTDEEWITEARRVHRKILQALYGKGQV